MVGGWAKENTQEIAIIIWHKKKITEHAHSCIFLLMCLQQKTEMRSERMRQCGQRVSLQAKNPKECKYNIKKKNRWEEEQKDETVSAEGIVTSTKIPKNASGIIKRSKGRLWRSRVRGSQREPGILLMTACKHSSRQCKVWLDGLHLQQHVYNLKKAFSRLLGVPVALQKSSFQFAQCGACHCHGNVIGQRFWKTWRSWALLQMYVVAQLHA